MKARGVNAELHHDDGRDLPAAGSQQAILRHLVDAAQSLQAAHELARDAGRVDLMTTMRGANELVGKCIHQSCSAPAPAEAEVAS